jgi:SAM-dependent methyltransferase
MSTNEDPATPDFWDVRFREKRTPWDAGSTPPDLERYLAKEIVMGRVLIPGCGSAYEVRTFAEKGYDVVAIDFAQAAVDRAKEELGEWYRTVILGDFFSYDFGATPFDIIYERAFLASLPPKMWTDYVTRVADLLRPGAKLIGFFVYGQKSSSPPFCLKEGELGALLGDRFQKAEDAVVDTSVPVFQGRERWEVWNRRK